MTFSPRLLSSVSRPIVAAILSQFPRYDEAFILRELVALSQEPQELAIFSLRPCRDRVMHAQAKALVPQTVYAPFVWSWKVWTSHMYFLRRTPQAYWGALGWIFSRYWAHPVILLRTLAFFPKTVHFARLAQQHGVTQLHAFWATYPASTALLMSRLTGIPYSFSGHAHDLYTTNPTLIEKLRNAQFVVTCTEANRQHLLKLLNGLGQETRDKRQETGDLSPVPCPIVVSYHGVDLSRFTPAPKRSGGTCELLAVGSLLPCKGLETLIEACRLLKQRRIPFHCTIAGGGPLERSLRRQIERADLASDVEITGFVSQETVIGLYQRAHLILLPLVSKIHWGIPNVLIEALATKTPVICCDLPSMKELVAHGDSGWVIPEQNPAALANSVEYLWGNPTLRAQLAEAGYRRVAERFSLERTGEHLRALFQLPTGANGLGHETGDMRHDSTRPMSHVSRLKSEATLR